MLGIIVYACGHPHVFNVETRDGHNEASFERGVKSSPDGPAFVERASASDCRGCRRSGENRPYAKDDRLHDSDVPLVGAPWMTLNESRAAAGLQPVLAGDKRHPEAVVRNADDIKPKSDGGSAAPSTYDTPVWKLAALSGTGTYTLSVRDNTPPPDDPPDDSGALPEADFREGDTDLPANDETTGEVVVDGFGARGVIHAPIGTSIDIGTENAPEISTSYVFDTDWFAVELEAGKTYRIDMKGQILSSPGLDTPGEPELTLSLPQINAIYDADGDYLLNTWGADESSAHHLFRVTFHARAGGTYYIAASGYELTVIDTTEDAD